MNCQITCRFMPISPSTEPGMQTTRQLFFTPDEYFDGLIADIEAARLCIAMETYIFKLDEVGQAVVSALRDATARGVSLQLLVDGIGSYSDAGKIAGQLKSDNSEVRIFHPLPWDFALYRRALKADRWYSQTLYLIASVNHRNHRKLCLIDGRIAWLGSFNITADHFNRGSPIADDYWHDTGLRVTGPALPELVDNFSSVWQRKITSARARSRRFLAGEARSMRRQPRQQLVRMLESATRRIWITNAYFNPSHQVLKALRTKAEERINIMLLAPRRSDSLFFPILSRSFYADLLQAGIQVFEYDHRILHTKTMIIDDQLIVGSTNLNYRSLFHDLELDFVSDDLTLVAQLEKRFDKDVRSAIEITLADWQQHPWLDKLLGLLARFLRYWL